MQKARKLKVLLFLIVTFLITGCFGNNGDALKFKEDYESLNGEKNSRGMDYRTVNISENNPFIISDADTIVSMIEKNETFYVYFGDKKCPWCRSTIESAVNTAIKNSIKKIYYVPIWDDEGNEVLRDRFTINENGEYLKTVEGTTSYYQLLNYFDSLLKDYTINFDENVINIGEKRIYAPSFIYVENGKPKRFTTGTSDLQVSSSSELTDEIKKEQEELYKDFYLGDTCSTDLGC